jgi:pyrimidine operon attenuation protein / uracil phosphoribosyltransferase
MPKILLPAEKLGETIDKLVAEITKAHSSFSQVVFVGIQQGGVVIADEIVKKLEAGTKKEKIVYGQLDITFYRDDIRKNILAPDRMNLPFNIENKIVILIDDVLFTGRTIKAALDVLLDYGRPARVELCVLVDRKEHRQFPIQADYVGVTVKTTEKDKVKLITTNGEKQVVVQ